MKLEKSFSFDLLKRMISSAQIRAGRGLLKWTRGVLASRAAILAVTLNMIESDQIAPRQKIVQAIRSVLEGEGVSFIGNDSEGYGVLPRQRVAASPMLPTIPCGI